MIRDGYVARWRGQEYSASPNGNDVRLYRSELADGFREVSANRYVRVVPFSEIDELVYIRTTCVWQGQPFIVLAQHGTWLRVEYTGGRWPVAEAMGLETFEFGVYQGWAPTAEVTDLREQRL